jgi:hypothetical protein
MLLTTLLDMEPGSLASQTSIAGPIGDLALRRYQTATENGIGPPFAGATSGGAIDGPAN